MSLPRLSVEHPLSGTASCSEDFRCVSGTALCPNGETATSGADEVYTDSLGRVEISLLDGDEYPQAEMNSAHQEMDKYWNQAA